MKKSLLVSGILGAMLVIITGCGNSGASLKKDTTINLGNGNSVTVSENPTAFPSGLPQDIPLYPGATITQSTTSGMTISDSADCKDDEKQTVKAVTLLVKDKGVGAEMKKFYADAVTKSGWKVDSDSELDFSIGPVKQIGFSAQKGDVKFSFVGTEGKSEDSSNIQTVAAVYVQQCIKK
jgi:hypothetical protein